MNHKVIVVFDGFADENSARWYGQWVKSTYPADVAEVYIVVVADTESK